MYHNHVFLIYGTVLLLLALAYSLLYVSRYLDERARRSEQRRQVAILFKSLSLPPSSMVMQLPYYSEDPANPIEGFIWFNSNERQVKIRVLGTNKPLPMPDYEKAKAMFRQTQS